MLSFIEQSDADDYFLTRLDSGLWEQTSQTNKDKALQTATRYINQLNFSGDKADANQTLEFPRGTDTEVPQPVKDATCELAYALLDGHDVEFNADQGNVESVSFGPGRIRAESDWLPEHVAHGIPSIVAWRLLKPFLREGETVKLNRVS